MKAVDYSAFSTGDKPVPVPVFQQLRSMFPSGDMLLNIPGAWHGLSGYSGARQSIRNGREAGFTHSATYTALTTLSGREMVERAQQFIGDEWSKLSFVAIDVELATVDIVEKMHTAVKTIEQSGVRPVFYTAKWAWTQYVPNVSFAAWPLWNAYYDDDPDLDFARYPYGGWELNGLAGEQYTNTTSVGGIGFDFNHFRDEFVTATDPPQVPPLVALVEAWKKDMADLAVNAADLIHTPFDTLRLALHSIYTSRRTEDWKALLTGGGEK